MKMGREKKSPRGPGPPRRPSQQLSLAGTAWLALQPRASTSMAARHVEAAAALLNSGDSEADFLEAKKLFQAALQVEPELRAAQ
jgi:hypothetical protein